MHMLCIFFSFWKMEMLSEELLTLIGTFLDAATLFQLEIVSSVWKQCLSHDFLWLDLTNIVWKKTGYVINVPRVDPMILRIQRSCSLKLIKQKILKYVIMNNILEKKELMIALRTKLLFSNQLSLTGDTIPNWCWRINDAKATYVYANNIESKRYDKLFASEIIMFEWNLYFKGMYDIFFL